MKNIIRWLQENGIEYSVNKYGNAGYFNDNFSVDGIQVAFYFDGIGNGREKERLLAGYMKRKRSYVCVPTPFGFGYTYRIMAVSDAKRLEEHENRVKQAVEKFWKEEHARRVCGTA